MLIAAAAAVPASAAGTQPKVLHALLSTGETALDPAVASDLASHITMQELVVDGGATLAA